MYNVIKVVTGIYGEWRVELRRDEDNCIYTVDVYKDCNEELQMEWYCGEDGMRANNPEDMRRVRVMTAEVEYAFTEVLYFLIDRLEHIDDDEDMLVDEQDWVESEEVYVDRDYDKYLEVSAL